MPEDRRSKSLSTASSASATSLLQDVPGAFPPATPRDWGDDQSTAASPQFPSLSHAVYARRSDYVKPKHLRIKIGTWNVGAAKGTEKDVGGWFVGGRGVAERLAGLNIGNDNNNVGEVEDVGEQETRYKRKKPTLPIGDRATIPGNEDIGLYVLGLQEVVDVNSMSEALRPYSDASTAARWKEELEKALPLGYELVAEQQLIGLLLLIYAAPEVVPQVRSVSTTSIGTGLGGYMGNKGAVSARIVLGETTRLVFVNSHLAAGADKAALERRNWDAGQIVSRTRFQPIKDAMDLTQSTGEQIGDEDFAFWVGDLNYRLEGIPGDDVRRLLMLHTRNEYDLSQRSAHKLKEELERATKSVEEQHDHRQSLDARSRSSMEDRDGSKDAVTAASSHEEDALAAAEDPTSLQTTLLSLLPHDELRQQMAARKAFHDGWREGPITFVPTYKYDIGSVGVFDSSEKKRAPSWCDRILYRTRRDRLAYEARVKEEENARKRDEEMRSNGLALAGEDEDILYDYDPTTDGDATALNEPYDEYDDYDDNQEPGEEDTHVVVTKEGFEDEIRLDCYIAHQRVLSSDHKPLDTVFTLRYDAVDADLKAKVHAEVAKEMDRQENEGRPSITGKFRRFNRSTAHHATRIADQIAPVVVDAHHEGDADVADADPASFEGLYLGDVRWAQGKHRTITIANTGRVPATFHLIERPVGPGQSSGIAPKWLNLIIDGRACRSSDQQTPLTTLSPGETSTLEVNVRIFDVDTVRALNEGTDALDDILLLRVDGGRDHFVPVRGNWQDSSLGHSIDRLCRIPEGGIRKLQSQKVHGNGSNSGGTSRSVSPLPPSQEQPVRSSAPRELFRLTEAIEELVPKVVSGWEMTNLPPSQAPSSAGVEGSPHAPWMVSTSWPFDDTVWLERDTELWKDMLSAACDALDTNQPLLGSLPANMSDAQKLYVLSDLLITFLHCVEDGIIPHQLWERIYTLMSDIGKRKHKLPLEDQRIAIEEILSESPAHSVSFIILTSMLQRVIQTARSHGEPSKAPQQAESLSKRPGFGSLRRMTGTNKLNSARSPEVKLERQQAYASVFASLVIRDSGSGGEKARPASARRKQEMFVLFLDDTEPG